MKTKNSRRRFALLSGTLLTCVSLAGLAIFANLPQLLSQDDAPAESAAPEAEAPEAELPADPLDWTYWRGPEFSGVSRETGLPDDWDPDGGEGSNVVWKNEDLGGRSTPVVMRGKLYTIVRAEPGTAREGERVVCVDAATGELLWENRFNVWLSDVPDTRVGWSSVVADPATGYVYALGVAGYFQCIDGETGETVWDHPLHEKFGLLSTYGGRTNFPVICDDLVIISSIVIGWGDMAKPAHRFLAFDKHTGEVVWFKGTRLLPYDTTYSAPTVTVLNGQKALVFGSGDGQVWAIQPRTGNPIWHYDFSKRGLNAPPLVVGDTIFAGHSEENISSTFMGAVVALDGTQQGKITGDGVKWRIEELMLGKTAPLAIGDRLYCFDDRAKLHILDIETGEPVVRRKALGTVMRASPLYADGKIYALTANGRWYIMKPDEEDGVEILNKGRMPRGEECHAAPIVSHGKIYIQTTGALYCVADSEKTPGVTERPEAPAEQPVADDPKPAYAQLVPAESLIKPGDTIDFRVRLYNSRGQLLGEADDVRYSVDGPGEVSADGTFTAPADARHVASTVHVQTGELDGSARVRIVPSLPWAFDFEGLKAPPVTWVGARYRHIIRNVDGNDMMVKITTIPKGTRSRSWFGHPELSNYTIQADVKGAISEDKMPDIGLIAQGYTLDLQGASQELQIRTWVPQLRMAKSVPFSWEPETWYTMKLQASVEQIEGDDGKMHPRAVLRGKVWPKAESEPADWTVEAYDDAPNVQGSPGLFGNAKDAEIFLDNIQVTPNS